MDEGRPERNYRADAKSMPEPDAGSAPNDFKRIRTKRSWRQMAAMGTAYAVNDAESDCVVFAIHSLRYLDFRKQNK